MIRQEKQKEKKSETNNQQNMKSFLARSKDTAVQVESAQLDELGISNMLGCTAWDARESPNRTSTYIKMNYSRETR